MSKTLLVVLGNGFTIDFLKFLNGIDEFGHGIDVSNLFKDGASVPWPATGEPGFLSFKHCPNLWNLGARPNMSTVDSMRLIEDIITCVNVYASNPNKSKIGAKGRPNDIYIYAYKELSSYLKKLFVFYDNKIPEIPDSIVEWSWVKYLQHVVASSEYAEVHVVTYNYDVWLERVLMKVGMGFDVVGFQNNNNKIKLYKPHGSISFNHKTIIDRSAFGIKYDRELLDGNVEDFDVSYVGFDENYLVNAMIPPAGESARLNHSWAGQIQREVESLTKRMMDTDECLVCGISYWHVDRRELDEILVNCHPGMNVRLVNPNPSPSLVAVIASIFDNFVLYPDSNILCGFVK